MATELERLIVRLEADTERLRREMKRAEGTVQQGAANIDRSTRRVDQGFASAQRAAMRFGVALLAVLGPRAIARAVRGALETADAIADTAANLGLTTDALQEYEFAANLSGVTTETLRKSMERFNRRLGDAAVGSGELLPVMERYGIAITDAEGRTRATGDVMADFADVIQSVEDPAERARLAYAAFGRAGIPVLRMLENGSAGLDDFARAAHEAGVIINAETVQAADKLADELETADKAMSAATTTLLVRLGPALVVGADLLADFAQAAVEGGAQLNEMMKLQGILPFKNELEELEVLGKRLELLFADLNFMLTLPEDRRFPGREQEIMDEIAGIEARAAALRAIVDSLPPESEKPRGDPLLPPDPEDEARAEASRQQELERWQGFFRQLLDERDMAAGMEFAIIQRQRFDQLDMIQGALDKQIISEEQAAQARLLVEQNTQEKLGEIREKARQEDLQRLEEIEERKADAAAEALRKVEEATRKARDNARELGLTFTSAFEDAAIGGNDLRDVVRGLAQDLQRLLIRRTATEPLLDVFDKVLAGVTLGSLFGGGTAPGAFAAGAAGPPAVPTSFFGFAGGGTPTPGLPALVGERGPELMVPMEPSRILSASQTERVMRDGGSRSGPTMTFNIDARGADRGGLMMLTAQMRRLESLVNNPLEMAKRAGEGFRRSPGLR